MSLDEVAAGAAAPATEAQPHARAAEEMARLDLEARREGRALGEPGADAIPVNRTLPAGPPEEVAARAGEGLREGYSCFKLKVGLPDDVERVAAVRAAIGPWPALRLDANGAWRRGRGRRAIAALEPYDLQLVEQPCAHARGAGRGAPAVGGADRRRRGRCARPADVRAAARAPGLRRGERQAGRQRRLRRGPRGAARGARAAACARSSRARSTAPGASPPRCSWRPPRAFRWPAAWPRSSCSTPRSRRPCRRRSDGLLPVPQGPGLGVEVPAEALAAVLASERALS